MRRLGPLAGEFKGQVQFVAVDVTQYPALKKQYGVRGVPVTMFFSGGRERDRVTGSRPAFWLRNKVKRFVAKG